MHRVADVVQIPRPWIRSEEREYRRQPRPHSPSFPCDPRLCNDSRARCAATIFLYSPFSVFSSLRFVSRLYPSSSPSPSSIPAVIARPCPHRSSSPSSSPSPPPHHVKRANVRRQHTGIYASPGPHLRVLESSGSRPLSLSLSLCHLGHIPELGTQAPFCITPVTRK